MPYNNHMQSDFGELALPSAADARRYVVREVFDKPVSRIHRIYTKVNRRQE